MEITKKLYSYHLCIQCRLAKLHFFKWDKNLAENFLIGVMVGLSE